MATADEVTVQLTSVTDGYRRGLTQAEQAFTKTMRSVAQSAGAMARQASSSFGGLAATLIEAFAVKKLYDFTRETIDAAAKLVDLADRLKISTELLQEYQAAAKDAGISSEDFNNLIEVFARNVGEASRGQGDLYKVLQLNGIAIRDQSGAIKPLNVLFEEYIDLIHRSTDAATTAKLSQIGFGRAAAEVGTLAKNGSAGIRAQGEEFKRAGGIMDDSVLRSAKKLDDEFNKLEASISKTFKTLAISAGPAILQVIGAFNDLVHWMEAHPAIARVIGWAIAGGRVGGLPGAILGAAKGAVDSIIPNGPQALLDSLNSRTFETDFATPDYAARARQGDLSRDASAAAARYRASVHAPAGGAGSALSPPKLPAGPATPLNEYEKAIRDIQEQTKALDTERESYGKSTFEITKNAEALKLHQAREEAGLPDTKASNAAIDEQATKYATAAVALEKVTQAQDKLVEATNAVADAFKQGFSDAILGASSLKEALSGVLQKLASMALDKVWSELFTPGVGAGQGGTGPLAGVFQAIGSFFGAHASGGNIPTGGWGTANENEIVRATSSGALIIPNGQASAGRGSTTHRSSTFNISVEASGNQETDGQLLAALDANVRAIMRDEARSMSRTGGQLNPIR